jgi:hypothetical protein
MEANLKSSVVELEIELELQGAKTFCQRCSQYTEVSAPAPCSGYGSRSGSGSD